jgi:hypothetical protein
MYTLKNTNMNVPNHAALTKTTTVVALFLSVLTLGACTKHVTQVVDQGFSAVYTVHASDFKTTDGGVTYTVNLNVPEVTQNIVDNGGVMVYLSLDGGASYEALPEFFQTIAYGTYHQVGSVSVDLTAANHTDVITAPTDPSKGYYLIKVVILDATPLPN